MKKGWKVFWIICAVLAGLGVLLCLVGAVTGATLTGVRSVLSSAGMDDDLYEWDEKNFGAKENAEEGTGASQSTDVNEFTDVRELDIEVTYLKVEIEEYEGRAIRVDTSEIDENLRNSLNVQSGEELKIEIKNKNRWQSLYKNNTGTLTIQIPADYSFREVSIDIGAGELWIENITASELSINVGAGRAVAERFTADKIEVDCGAGEAEITGAAGREIKIECGVGSTTYHALGSQKDYNYVLECGIGEITVGEDSFSGMARETRIDNNGSITMEIDCGIGEVNVTFEE